MKMIKKLVSNSKFAGLALGMVALIAINLQAIPIGVKGVFNSVNSALGYEVAGAAGTLGQALCSDGTRFNTACTIPTAPAFTGTSGYQILPSGLILQWGSTGSIPNDTPTSVSFPIAFPNAALSVTCSDVFASSHSAIWSCYGWTTTGFTGRPDTNAATAQYVAIGY